MAMKYFGPFYYCIKPLTGASFGNFLVEIQGIVLREVQKIFAHFHPEMTSYLADSPPPPDHQPS